LYSAHAAKLSVRSWDFDIGWMYLCILRALGLDQVKKVAPKPVLKKDPRPHVDLDNLRAVIVNRMHVLRDYTRQVTLPVLKRESARTTDGGRPWGVRMICLNTLVIPSET